MASPVVSLISRFCSFVGNEQEVQVRDATGDAIKKQKMGN